MKELQFTGRSYALGCPTSFGAFCRVTESIINHEHKPIAGKLDDLSRSIQSHEGCRDYRFEMFGGD
jgi:hypothetical protein